MAFYETRFPECISYGSVGGPSWKTDVIVFDSGFEQRNQRWANLRNVYDVAYGVRSIDDLRVLVAFFNEMRGRAHTFRYKDWLDFQVTNEPLVPTGTGTVQLIKTYGNGFNNYTKQIKKPVSGQVALTRNGSPFTTFSVDTTTGIVTLTAISSKNITAITQANPGVISSTAHGFTNGQQVLLSSIGGMTQLNGQLVTVTVVDPNSYSIGINTTGYTAYTSGGVADLHVQPSDTLTWTGEFDIPCRFDTDQLDVNYSHYQAGETSVPLVEVRV